MRDAGSGVGARCVRKTPQFRASAGGSKGEGGAVCEGSRDVKFDESETGRGNLTKDKMIPAVEEEAFRCRRFLMPGTKSSRGFPRN